MFAELKWRNPTPAYTSESEFLSVNALHLPWEQWLLATLALAALCWIAASISVKREGNSFLATLCVVGGGLGAVITFIITVIYFAKWAWNR